MTKEECIQELLHLQDEFPDRSISRDFFRSNSDITEHDWTKHFGTFAEFKRQAGLTHTRYQSKVLNSIARVASNDRLKEVTEAKRQFEGTYERPSSKRFQSLLIASDIHDIEADPFYIRTLLDTLARLQPERFILNGDIFDFPEFSKYTQDPREWRAVERINWVHDFLRQARELAPNTQIDFIEGNHEHRLLRHLAESAPGVVSILSDLHGLTIPDLLGLRQFEVNFIARSDLAAFNKTDIKNELKKNYVIINDQVLFSHYPDAYKYGYPGANGHHHKHLVKNGVSPIFGSYEWHQTGCGHMRHAGYCSGEKWSNGFLIAHLDTHNRRTQFEYVDTSHAHVLIGGKFYERNKEEMDFFV